jgi:general secretion pathway protein D
LVPDSFPFRSGVAARCGALLLALLAAGCQTTGDGPLALDTTSRPPPVARADDGKSAAAHANDMPLPGNKDSLAAAPSFIHRGTGQLIGAPPAHPSATAHGIEDGVTVNLVNASIAQASKTVLGDILGLNYSVNTKLEGKITIQTSTPVSQSELVDLFQSALRANGATIVRNGGAYQVEPADQAAKSISDLTVGATDNTGGIVGSAARVIQLKYVAASEMRRILEPIVQKGAILRADDARNTLTLSGTAADVGAMLDAVSVFDVDVMQGMSVVSVPVRAGTPDAIADDLRAIFGTDKEGPLSGMVRFVPNQRLKSILVISPQQRYLTRAERMVRELDARTQGPEKQLFTYNARNRPAKELVGAIESIFSSSSHNATQTDHDVAPRYQDAAVQSAQTASAGGLPSYGGGPAGSAGGGAPLGGGGAPFGGGGVNIGGQAGAASSATGASSGSSSSPSSTSIGGQSGEEERVRLSVDEPNNTLLIMASRADYQRVLRILHTLDVVPDQVLIEAVIAEVSLDDDLQFGVRWNLTNNHGSTISLTDAAAGTFGAVFPGFSYALATANAQVTLNALASITQVNVVSSPTLTVLNNRTATLQVGDQVPIVTQSAVGVVTAGAPIVNSVNYRDTGVILSITPRINESGRVLLNIEQEVSSVATTTTSNIDSPTIKQRRVKTTVLVNDGEALALGGLIQDQISDARTQVPILGDIPVVGALLRQKTNSLGKTELIVLITPHVVRNLNQAREITDEYRRQFDVSLPHVRGARRPIGQTIERTFN